MLKTERTSTTRANQAFFNSLLVLTDINMPGSMDGLKLAHAVRDRWPPIKIIVVSGEVRPSQNDLPSNSYFFRKPFLADNMISEIRSLIGA